MDLPCNAAEQPKVNGLTLKPGSLLALALKKRLADALTSQGVAATDASNAIDQLTDDHPLLDWFMTYGLPQLIQLLLNLIPKPTPAPAPTPTT